MANANCHLVSLSIDGSICKDRYNQKGGFYCQNICQKITGSNDGPEDYKSYDEYDGDFETDVEINTFTSTSQEKG